MDEPTTARFTDTILDSINEGVFTVDLDKRIRSFNAAAERITEVPRSEALGKRCFDVFRANLCQKQCAMNRTLDTGTPVVNSMAYIINAAGESVPVRISTALLKDTNGRTIGGVETFQDLTQVERLCREFRSKYTFEGIIGRSPPMTRLFQLLPQVAQSESTVLIEGPSGTGKELFARTLHSLSRRCKGRFVAVNCAAFPDTLLESELFGYKAGAFTDARQDKPGRFTLANGGTIFLDEISDTSPALQVRLLRVLQERVIEPLGSLESVRIDVRVLASANQDLHELVRQGLFREDLFYRIRVVHLTLPPLVERREDIPPLVDRLIERFNHDQERQVIGVSDQVMTRLLKHDFPGNVRELENIIEQAFVLCRGDIIEVRHLPPELRQSGPISLDDLGGPVSLKAMEKILIAEALQRHHGNRTLASRCLGINPSTLYRKIQALDIQPPAHDGRSRP